MIRRLVLALMPAVLFLAALQAESGLQPLEVKERLGDINLSGDWIYEDLKAGFKKAQKTGKPLLIVFR